MPHRGHMGVGRQGRCAIQRLRLGSHGRTDVRTRANVRNRGPGRMGLTADGGWPDEASGGSWQVAPLLHRHS
jgi:hypothetical protein